MKHIIEKYTSPYKYYLIIKPLLKLTIFFFNLINVMNNKLNQLTYI